MEEQNKKMKKKLGEHSVGGLIPVYPEKYPDQSIPIVPSND